jgi:hypothetical protein
VFASRFLELSYRTRARVVEHYLPSRFLHRFCFAHPAPAAKRNAVWLNSVSTIVDGATLTTLYLQFEKEAEAALGLPPGVHSYAILPIGYPIGRFGPVRRVPLADVVYEDRWGQLFSDRSVEPPTGATSTCLVGLRRSLVSV